ncbi:MAG: ATP-dependent Clp protease adaptor ClpS [bacterium]
MKRIEFEALTLDQEQQARPARVASLRAIFDIEMGIATPYEDEEVLVEDDISSRLGEPWKVILYNDDVHTFDEVIVQLQKALGCGQSRAEKIAFEAHSRGKAIAYDGAFEECFRVMGILREIQLLVEIEG